MTNTCTDHSSGSELSAAPPRIRILPAPAYEPQGSADVPSPHAALRDDQCAARSGHRVAQPATVTGTRASAQRAVAIAAREFSVGTLTMIFEVMARRRPASHLQHRVALHVDDQIGARARTRVTGEDACIPTVRRVHVQMCDAGAAEIFGTYARQGRSRAFAGRIERVPCRVRVHGDSPGGRYSPVATRVEYRWQLVVLTLG